MKYKRLVKNFNKWRKSKANIFEDDSLEDQLDFYKFLKEGSIEDFDIDEVLKELVEE